MSVVHSLDSTAHRPDSVELSVACTIDTIEALRPIESHKENMRAW